MGSSVERFLRETGGQGKPPADTTTLTGSFLGDEEERRRLKAAQAFGGDGDAAGRILGLEAKTGLPHDLIERNLDQIQAEVDKGDFDLEKFRRTSPLMAQWLSEHPKHFALASNDLTKLNWLEKQWRNVKSQFGAGVATTKLEEIGTRAMLGKATPEDRKRQKELEDQMALASVLPEELDISTLGQAPGAMAQQIPIFAKTAAAGAAGALVVGGLSRSGKGAQIGWRVGSGVEAGRMEASLAYLEFEKLRDDRGEPLSRNTALGAAIVTGIINGSLEMMGFEEMAKTIPGMRALTRDGLKQALTKATTGRALRRYLENIGSAAVTEGFTEFMQEMVTSTAGELATMTQDGTGATMSIGQILDRIFSADHLAGAFEAGKQGALAGGGMTTATGTAQVATDIAKARRAKAAAQVMNDLAVTVNESKMMERLPDKMQEAVERLAADGQVPTLYAPVAVWTEYWQKKDIDPEQAAAAILGPKGAEAFAEAERTGGDIEIPTGRYATTLAATDHHAFFINELRSGPNELSAREAQEMIQAMDAESEAVEQEAKDERKEQITEIVGKIKGQLVEAGFDDKTAGTYSSMFQNVFNMAPNMSPQQVYDMMGLSISRLDEAEIDESAMAQDINPHLAEQLRVVELTPEQREADPRDLNANTTRGNPDYEGDGSEEEGTIVRKATYGLREEGIYLHLDPKTKVARIVGSMLSPDLRNRGIGTALYQRLFDQALAEGYQVYSDNDDVSESAERVYRKLERLGYEVIEHGRDSDAPGIFEVRAKRKDFFQASKDNEPVLPDIPRDTPIPQRVQQDIFNYMYKIYDDEDFVANPGLMPPLTRGWGEFEDWLYKSIEDGNGTFNQQLFTDVPSLQQWRYSFGQSARSVAQLLAGFHSKAERTIEQKMGGRATVAEVRALLREVKDEEKRWTGINEFLDSLSPQEKVTKEQVLRALQAGRLEIKEIDRLAEIGGNIDDDAVTAHAGDIESETYRTVAREIAAHVQVAPSGKYEGVDISTLPQNEEIEWSLAFDDLDYDTEVPPTKHAWRLFGDKLKDYFENPDYGTIVRGRNFREALAAARQLILDEITTTPDDSEDLKHELEEFQERVANDALEHAYDTYDDAGENSGGYEYLTLPGGENYREILITLPRMSPGFLHDHFEGAENVVVHFRLKDRVGPDGNKMLFIEEIQSDWHQAGRDFGYRDDVAAGALHLQASKMLDRMKDLSYERGQIEMLYYPKTSEPFPQERISEIEKLTDELDTLTAERDAILAKAAEAMGGPRSVHQAPFKSNWQELALKRILRMAAENGYESIGWTTGDQQAERNNLSHVVDEIAWEREMVSRPKPGAQFRPMTEEEQAARLPDRMVGRNPEMIEMESVPTGRINLLGNKFVDAQGVEDPLGSTRKVVFRRNVEIKDLHDLVGKELTAKISERFEAGEMGGEFSGDELKVGGHGMREFYDKIVPSFLKRFTKKYGAEVGQIELAGNDYMIAHRDIAAKLGRNPTQEEFDAAQAEARGPTVHHLALTPELKRAAMDEEFTLFQSEWKHRAIRATFAGNTAELRGIATSNQIPLSVAMKHLPLMEFMADYGINPDMLNDIELVINKNPRPNEGKYRTTVLLKQRRYDAEAAQKALDEAIADMEKGGNKIFESIPFQTFEKEEVIPIGHIAHDDPKEMEKFVEDLQFKPIEYRQSKSEVIRNARNEMAELIEATELDTIDLETRVMRDQETFIRKHFGDTAAEEANYGWGIGGSKAGAHVETKVYGYGILVSEASVGSSDVVHTFQGFDATHDDIYEVASMPDVDRRDIHGLEILGKIRDALNRGTPAETRRLLMQLDMVNEVMRTSIKEYAPHVEKWANEMFQGDADEPRGRIRIGTGSIDIELLKGADLSTFIHETGHFFLETMKELAPENENVAADLKVIRDWLGMKEGQDFGRAEHELFARGFERYLGEGKAPVPRLQMAFARFKAWLVLTYESLTDLNVELTDEVRNVFDRLLASQDEIAKAQVEQNQQPLFADPAAVGMTPEQAEVYNDNVREARLAAEEELTAKIMQEFEREKSRVWNAERIKVRAEVADEADQDPILRVFSLLKNGRLPSGARLEGFTPFKLDKADVLEQFKVAVSERLLATTGGKTRTMSPAPAADLFGFSSPEELLDALAASEDPKDWIEKTTNSRMRTRRYEGTPLKTSEIPVEAKKAVHNEKRAQLLQKELEILAKQSMPTLKGMVRKITRRLPKIDEIRAEAQRIVETKLIRDIKPDVYRRAEAESAKKAMDLFLKGDFEGAFDQKTRELLNHELFRAASTAKDAITAGVKFMRKFDDKKARQRLGRAGGNYLEQIDSLLERFDFRELSGPKIDRKQSLRDFLNEQSALGLQPDLPESVLNEAYRKNYKELSFEEFKGVIEGAKLIRHLSTLKNKLLAVGRGRTIQQAVDDIVGRIRENFKADDAEPVDLAPGLGERLKRGAKGLIAAHTKMEFLFEWLDGNKNNGPVWRNLFEPLARAEADEYVMMQEAVKGLKSIFSAYPKSERSMWFWRKTKVAAVNMSFTKGNMLAVALNWGNEGNRQALMEGYGWSQEQVEAILSHLDAKDWEAVQRVWDLIDQFWPQIEKLEKDLNGLAPQKVEALQIANKHGTFRGGYYPIAFDSQLSWKQALLEKDQQTNEMFGGRWAQVGTRHGHTKERVGSGGKPVKLDLSVLAQHISNVVHDLTHRRAIIDVNRLSQRDEVRIAIENSAGKEMYRQIHPWLLHVARGQQTEFQNPIEGLFARGRMGATVVNMGWKMSTAIVQFLSYTNTIKELGPKYATLGISDVWAQPWKLRESWDFIKTRSPFMDARITSYDRDVRDALASLNVAGVESGPLSFLGAYTGPVRNSFFMLIGLMDMAVSVPSWMGAYRKAMEGAAEGIEKGDENAAVQYADKVVRETQGVGAAKDLAAVQRGSEVYKIFAMFYSYFSVLFNQFAKTQHQLHLDKKVGKYVASLAMLWFVPAIMQDLILGRGPDEDADEEEWLKWLAKTEAKYPFQTIIIVRDIINGMDRFGYEPSAALDMFGSISTTLKNSGKIFTEEEITRADAKAAAEAAGYATQLPSRQLWQTSEYMYDWLTGSGEVNENPFAAAWEALVTGRKKE